MRIRRFTNLLTVLAISLLAITTSCQKDPAVKEPDAAKTSVAEDSTTFLSPGNFLAASGTLTVKFQDSTYTFDASKDSIAFISVHIDDNTRYFGITAINKQHNMSFGISSAGFPYSNIKKPVAGGQLIINTNTEIPALQLSLSKYSGQKDFGSISLAQYNQGNTLAKGTFFTFLAKDDNANSPYYRVEGSFELKLK